MPAVLSKPNDFDTRFSQFLVNVTSTECDSFHLEYEFPAKCWNTKDSRSPVWYSRKLGRVIWSVVIRVQTRNDRKKRLLSIGAHRCKLSPKGQDEPRRLDKLPAVPSMSAECTGEATFKFPKDTYGSVVEFSAQAAGQLSPSSDLELCGMRFRAKGVVRSVIVDGYLKSDTFISLMTASRVRLEDEPNSEAFSKVREIAQSLVHVREK